MWTHVGLYRKNGRRSIVNEPVSATILSFTFLETTVHSQAVIKNNRATGYPLPSVLQW